MRKVIFTCVRNAGRSQIAAAFFNRLADTERVHAISAGTDPAKRVHPEVVAVMREVEIDLSKAEPTKLTPELSEGATLIVTMGCGDECPNVPGARRQDWAFLKAPAGPKGLTREYVRRARDDIARRVQELVTAEGWEEPFDI